MFDKVVYTCPECLESDEVVIKGIPGEGGTYHIDEVYSDNEQLFKHLVGTEHSCDACQSKWRTGIDHDLDRLTLVKRG